MSTGSNVVVRPAHTGDVDRILDLLTHYDRDRAYFEPWYLQDPTYSPQQSWVVEQDGRLLAHLRVFDRQVRIGSSSLKVAGIGNVVTAREARGQGHAGLLLRTVIETLIADGYAYSLLWTHLPELYARFGWVSIDEIEIRAELSPTPISGRYLQAFCDHDLSTVMELYERINVGRTGTAIRSPLDWRAQLAHVESDTSGFVLARSPAGVLLGYSRSRSTPNEIEITELTVDQRDRETGRQLLWAAAERTGGQLHGRFPPSLRTLFETDTHSLTPDRGLMGRLMDTRKMVRSMGPLWSSRLRETGQEFSFTVSTDADSVSVRVTPSAAHVTDGILEGTQLDEARFAQLLFHGVGKDHHRDDHLLVLLFPQQDFVIWGADSF